MNNGTCRPLADRFWPKVKVAGKNDCWLWTAGKTSAGYGAIGLGHDKDGIALAHRISYEMHFGPIKDHSKYVCHRCDNPACVNPAHLFLGTPSDNMFDCIAKGRNRHPRGSAQKHAKLTEKEVLKIRQQPTVSSLALSAEYGVHHSVIWQIRHRKIWNHI